MKELIIILLSLLMLSMGLNLKLSDFKNILKSPKIIIFSLLLQYSIMPLLAFIISLLLGLRLEYMIGMVLVGATSGGLASNLMCYLARANLALSITLTSFSTVLSVFLTPIIVQLYLANQVIEVNSYAMLFTLIKIVVVPVLLGMIINQIFKSFSNKIKVFTPFFSKIAILVIITLIIIINKDHISEINITLFFAVILHNIIGLILGYYLAKTFTKSLADRRAIAIEIAMQNSGLAAVLALKHFSALAALPAVIFSVWHNISGLVLANYWSKRN